jgi:hypothetical protein
MEYLVIGTQRTLRIAQNSLWHGAELLYDARTSDEHNAVELQDREFFAAIAASRVPSVSPDDVLPALEILQRVQDQNGGRCGEARGKGCESGDEQGACGWLGTPGGGRFGPAVPHESHCRTWE